MCIRDSIITEQVANLALDLLDVDKYGLDSIDRNILQTMIEKFKGGPVGLDTLAASISEDAGTLEAVSYTHLKCRRRNNRIRYQCSFP